MQKKTIAMMAAAGCMIGMLTGCGVPEEEHLAVIADLEAKHQKAVDELNDTVSEKQSVVDSQKAKLRTKSIDLDNANSKVNDLKNQNAKLSKELAAAKAKGSDLERAVSSAKSAAAAAREDAAAAAERLAALEAENAEVKRRFEQFQKNMQALSAATSPSQASTSATPSKDQTPLDILNQMSTQ